MKNSIQKGSVYTILLVIVAIILIAGGWYFYQNTTKSDVVENIKNNTTELNSPQNPNGLLSQVKQSLNLSSEVKNANPAYNAYQLTYPKDQYSQVISYFDKNLKKLWEKEGATVFANGYMQCTVSQEAAACLNYFEESGSMRPTLTQEQVLNTKTANELTRGDIIVFANVTSKGEKITLTKRIIGLPGETLKIENGNIYINNQIVKNVGPISVVKPQTSNQSEIKLSNDQYYVLGDNTEQSYDSRAAGPITSSDILAEVIQ